MTQRIALALALLLPGSALASNVKITTDPPQASVQLDGVAYGPAPVTIPKVSTGMHELTVSLEGYVTRVDTLQVSGDEDMEIQAPLNPVPKVYVPPPKPTTQALVPPPAPYPQGYAVQQPQQPVAVPPPPAPQYQQPYQQPGALPPPPGYVAQQPVAAPQGYAAQQPAATALPPPPPVTAVDTRTGAPAAPVAAPQVVQNPLPVSQNPTAWGAQKKSITLRVDTEPSNASVQVVGLPDVKPAPAVFSGFSAGRVRLLVRAPGYKDREVMVELHQDARTVVALERQ